MQRKEQPSRPLAESVRTQTANYGVRDVSPEQRVAYRFKPAGGGLVTTDHIETCLIYLCVQTALARPAKLRSCLQLRARSMDGVLSWRSKNAGRPVGSFGSSRS
jgi:hypothetical protein